MKAATLTRTTVHTLIAILVTFATLFTTLNLVHAAPPEIDPIDGILANVSFDREAGENGIYTAELTRGEYVSTITLEFTEEMTPSFDLVDGHVDVYQETVNDDDGTISQGNRYYVFHTLSVPTHSVMLAIKGQNGDPSFDNSMVKLANNQCRVIVVIDNAADELSGEIYTRIGCQMTQLEIDNAGELLGDALLAITPLYTTYIPVAMN